MILEADPVRWKAALLSEETREAMLSPSPNCACSPPCCSELRWLWRRGDASGEEPSEDHHHELTAEAARPGAAFRGAEFVVVVVATAALALIALGTPLGAVTEATAEELLMTDDDEEVKEGLCGTGKPGTRIRGTGTGPIDCCIPDPEG